MVVLDNTNTQRWEYAGYEEAAAAAFAECHGGRGRLQVVEIALPVPAFHEWSLQQRSGGGGGQHHGHGHGKGKGFHGGGYGSGFGGGGYHGQHHGGYGYGGHDRNNNHSRAPPPPPHALRLCADRNAHGVPLDAIVRMWGRWEPDARAFVVPAGGFA